MKNKLKLSELLHLNQTLKLIIDDTETSVDSLFKFKLLGIMKSIEPYVANFETIRNEKISEYGEKTEDGRIGISPDDEDAIRKFNEDLSKVINSEISVNLSMLRPGEVFDKGVKAEYLIGLYPVIEE